MAGEADHDGFPARKALRAASIVPPNAPPKWGETVERSDADARGRDHADGGRPQDVARVVEKGLDARANGDGVVVTGADEPLGDGADILFVVIALANAALEGSINLEAFEAGTIVTPEVLIERGVIRGVKDGVKILGGGALSKALTVKAHKFSASSQEAIAKVGGKAELISEQAGG